MTDVRAAAALVVAHPDDEALWLSSAIAAADRIILCFGDLYERPKTSSARQGDGGRASAGRRGQSRAARKRR